MRQDTMSTTWWFQIPQLVKPNTRNALRCIKLHRPFPTTMLLMYIIFDVMKSFKKDRDLKVFLSIDQVKQFQNSQDHVLSQK